MGGRRCPWGTVAVHGCCCLWAQSLFVGLGVVVSGHGRWLGSRLQVLCHHWWVLGVVEGCPAVIWGWQVSFVGATLLFLGGRLLFVGMSSFVGGGLVVGGGFVCGHAGHSWVGG